MKGKGTVLCYSEQCNFPAFLSAFIDKIINHVKIKSFAAQIPTRGRG